LTKKIETFTYTIYYEDKIKNKKRIHVSFFSSKKYKIQVMQKRQNTSYAKTKQKKTIY